MPKRLFSDKAWASDKLAAVQEDFRAEYAWIYSLALCDGTFEADPKKVWSSCYAPIRQTAKRGAWTVAKVAELLDEFTQKGLLQTRIDSDGKLWGKWTNCEDCLPPRCDWHKHQRGKGFLFEQPANGQLLPSHWLAQRRQGVGFGLGNGNGDGAGAVSSLLPDADEADEAKKLQENTLVDINGRKRGEAGFFCKNQYARIVGTDPKAIHRQIAKSWQKFGPSEKATAYYPSKYPERWELLCDQHGADVLIPAFELWCVEEGARLGGTCPAGEFVKNPDIWVLKIIKPRNIKPALTQETIDRTNAVANAIHESVWAVKETATSEPDAVAFLETE